MSFGAMAAWQALGLLVLAGGVAAWLFYLKVRPPRVYVASLLLWRRVLDQQREQTWWERLRRAVSLIATVLIALALALAVARPGPAVSAGARGRMLIVIDSSWSMLADLPGGGTRWDRAIAQARALAASAAGDPVAVATTADGLVEGPTTDSALIETALGTLVPAGGEGAAWPRVGDADRIHFFTDGALARTLDPEVVVHSVHEPVPNVAITAFRVRPAAAAGSRAETYLEAANYADMPQDVRLVVTRGTNVVFDETVGMTSGEVIRQVLPLDQVGDPRLRARVSAPGNALLLDDEATAWLTESDPLAVTVVSENPDALAALLARVPGVTVTLTAPGTYDASAADVDVLVFEGWLPAQAPSRPALILSPPAAPWLAGPAEPEVGPRWSDSVPHPVLDGVDPFTLDIQVARGIGADLQPVAWSARGTALVGIAEEPDRRLVAIGFAASDSNLAVSPAFPVLTVNALEWLSRPVLGAPETPGPALLPPTVTRVVSPDGDPVPIVRAGEQSLVRFPAPGLYLVESGPARSVVSINVGGSDVSNLMRSTLGETALEAGSGLIGGRPWWMYAVMFAFMLVAVEWVTWLRRVTV